MGRLEANNNGKTRDFMFAFLPSFWFFGSFVTCFVFCMCGCDVGGTRQKLWHCKGM